MNKKSIHIFRLILALFVFAVISVFFCQKEFFSTFYSKILVHADSLTVQEIYDYETNNLSTTIPANNYYISKINVKEKEYDGTTNIEIESFEIKDASNNVFECDDSLITAQANTFDANAGNNKYVKFTNFQSLSSDIIIAGYDYEPVLVNILPFKNLSSNATLFWETKDISLQTPQLIESMGYVYTGIDQRKGISVYYKDINDNRVPLTFKIVGYSNYGTFEDEFIKAGSYTATAILTQKETNYYLVDNSGDITLNLQMNKATPQLVFNEQITYTYTGCEQSLSSYAKLNNNEQTLVYQNDKFKNLIDGKALNVKVYANASQNYKAFPVSSSFTTYQVPESKFVKRTSSINIDNIVKKYTYTGNEQTINKVAFIDDAVNTEQVLNYSSTSSFTNAQNNREITIFADATGNFNSISTKIYIDIAKAKIDTTYWSWTTSNFDYDGSKYSISISGYDSSLVVLNYSDNEFLNAGTYTATVSVILKDSNNYEEVSFPSKMWTINKKKIVKPVMPDMISVYNGSYQTINLSSSTFYKIANNPQYKDAGTYKLYVTLKDKDNYEWKDNSTDDVEFLWQIKKAQVETPYYANKLLYTGKEQNIAIQENAIYSVLGANATNEGNYQTHLILKDFDNYEWKDNPDKPYVTLNWSIVDNNVYDSSKTAIIIALVVVVIIIVAIYSTLSFTMKVKRKRKNKKQEHEEFLLEETNKINPLGITTQEKNVASIESKKLLKTEMPFETKNEPEIEEQEEIAENIEDEKVVANEKQQEIKNGNEENLIVEQEKSMNATNQEKSRKKRMISMKKNDKKERRKVENKKIAQTKKVVKRGRPPKKKRKTPVK